MFHFNIHILFVQKQQWIIQSNLSCDQIWLSRIAKKCNEHYPKSRALVVVFSKREANKQKTEQQQTIS